MAKDNDILKEGVINGEEVAKQFMDAIKLLLEYICSRASELQGRLAELRSIKKPEYVQEVQINSDDSDYDLKIMRIEQNRINLDNQTLVEIFD